VGIFYFSELLNVNWVNDMKQTKMQLAEALIPEPSFVKVETATEEFKRC